ncbi:hypothetical protein G6027_11290 [Dietzia sp. SLG310A2-38A2]|uniref:hypothetical protein n=1 Tax=Dietzia sp. SLG310A2-38A2 TaxID=1630643 RepID=UPI0015FD505D|nr:hypothetical protein [Dietzia sp. SLG310A2-38A2]MBB1031461.1 hypothetical protein [Dietzia sp. SLG310A2-38A2]
MKDLALRLKQATMATAVVLLAAACGGSPTEEVPALPTGTAIPSPVTPTTASAGATPSSAETTTAHSEPYTQTSPAAAIVNEGVACGPRGALAAFADGATAFCARLQYTDGAAWSRDPSLAPNPIVEESLRRAGPDIGDQCIGADIGRTATDAHGNAIACDNYRWVLNVGQEPRHPWVDDQVKWMECLEQSTHEECQEALN